MNSQLITLDKITNVVANYFSTSKRVILSHRRTAMISYVRGICYRLCRLMTGYSYPEIAEYFNKDHSTLIKYLNKPITIGTQLIIDDLTSKLLGEQNDNIN